MPDTNQPTRRQYGELDAAYDFFNQQLFDGTLPRCLITMQRRANASGFFHGCRFVDQDGADVRDEIALNPAVFRSCPVEETLSTLVHEMTHLWQHHFGNPGRTSYHNAEWADKMEGIGLMPSSTGKPGGKRTGQRMSDYIITDGPFERACAALLKTGFVLPYVQRTDDPKSAGKLASKTKFHCPTCGANAWGKPDLVLVCGTDGASMVRSDGQSIPAAATSIQPNSEVEMPKISSYPPTDNPLYAVGRAKIEAGTTALGNVAIKFQAMIGDASKAAYSRTYVNQYSRAWEKDGAYLFEMLELIKAEKTYSNFWMEDGVPQPTYETFEEYCEAEIDPFVGPLADLRSQYRRG